MSGYPLEAQREATLDLISEEPTAIVLSRFVSLRTPSGGTKPAAVVPQPEKIRFFAPTSSAERWITTTQGERLEVDYVLIGTFDDDIQENDEFTVDGQKYKVSWVVPDRRFQTKAFVVKSYG